MQKVNSSEKDLLTELKPSIENQSKLYSYLTKFDDKVLQTLRRQKAMLKTKYLMMISHVEKIKRQLEFYENKVMKLENDIDENGNLKNILSNLSIYRSYAQTLSLKFLSLEKMISQEEEKIKNNLILVNKKKKVIFQVNHENLIFSNNITKFQKILSINKSTIFPVINQTLIENSSILSIPTQANKSILLQENFDNLTKKLKLFEKKNNVLKKEIFNKAFIFGETKRFFEDSLELLKKNVIKSQEVIRSDGLKGSLLFEIQKNKNSKSKFIIENNPSNLQDREAKNLIFRTLNLLVEKKEGKNQHEDNPLIRLKVDWETFCKLDGRQIMGLLVVSSDVLTEVKKEFGIKQRDINEMVMEIKK